MKLLVTALGLAVLAYACQNEFAFAQKLSEEDSGFRQTAFSGKQEKAKNFTANTFNSTFINTEKRNSIVLPDNSFILKANAPLEESLNLEMKEITKAKEMVLNNGRKQSTADNLFPGEDFLFVSLIMVN
jgi:hypothetical protein